MNSVWWAHSILWTLAPKVRKAGSGRNLITKEKIDKQKFRTVTPKKLPVLLAYLAKNEFRKWVQTQLLLAQIYVELREPSVGVASCDHGYTEFGSYFPIARTRGAPKILLQVQNDYKIAVSSEYILWICARYCGYFHSSVANSERYEAVWRGWLTSPHQLKLIASNNRENKNRASRRSQDQVSDSVGWFVDFSSK